MSAKSKAFLPNSVTLSDWIERRIGGEVELDKEVVKVVSDEARQVVQEKYQALLRSRQPSGKVGGLLTRLGGSWQGKAGKGGLSGEGFEAPRNGLAGKDWLERLPPAELTGEEVNLRQALLDCLDQRRRCRPALRQVICQGGQGQRLCSPAGRCDASAQGHAEQVGAAANQRLSQGGASENHCISLMFHDFPSIFVDFNGLSGFSLPFPAGSKHGSALQDWIEARIGAEVELRQNARGRLRVQ